MYEINGIYTYIPLICTNNIYIYTCRNIPGNIHVNIHAHVNVQQVVTGSLVDCLCLLFLCRLNDELSENSLPHVVQQ